MMKQDLSYDEKFLWLSEYLKIIANKSNGFMYNIYDYREGNVSGSICNTETIRGNFKWFIGYISLDIMKR